MKRKYLIDSFDKEYLKKNKQLIDNFNSKNISFNCFLEINGYKNNDNFGNNINNQNENGNEHSSSYPIIFKMFCKNLTDLANQNKLDPLIGREKEIDRIIQILCRRTKNNPVLIGEPSVGKTAIVEGLSQKIIMKKVPSTLHNKKILSLDLALMVSGTKYRGQFEERIKQLVYEIERRNDIIIFIDELHMIVGTGGSSEGSMDISNILKPALSRGEFKCIGATTFNEYKKYLEKDGALERRFQPVIVNAPTIKESIKILNGISHLYENYHGCKFTKEAIKNAVKLSERYIPEKFLPDKAIDILDESGSKVQIKISRDIYKKENIFRKKIFCIKEKKEECVNKQKFEKAAEYRDRERKLRKDYFTFKKSLLTKKEKITVDKSTIISTISNYTGIPIKTIQKIKDKKKEYNFIANYLRKKIVGQEDAIKLVLNTIKKFYFGIGNSIKPIGSFMFLGPTGVGKTYLAQIISKTIFGNKKDFKNCRGIVQINMSEYMEKHSISRLIGSPPGYIGYEEGGQLTEKIKRNPYSVILFDEIEKAHKDICNVLLQILEEGKITDSKGKTINFRNTIIIMTSNIGSKFFENEDRNLGFHNSLNKDVSLNENQKINRNLEIKKNAIRDLKNRFRSEFINRIDRIIVFNDLNDYDAKKILRIEIKKICKKFKKNWKINLNIENDAQCFLLKKGFKKKYGARSIKRFVETFLKEFLVDNLLKNYKEIKLKKNITLSISNQKIKLNF
jgi:ATP-dependent Clp protease ATP-binding subunit ClpC